MATRVNQTVSPLRPVLATALGIGLLSLMDALMKMASLELGAYMAAVVRSTLACLLIAPLWLASRPQWPSRSVLKVHVIRGVVGSMMALSFFYSLTKLPLAETIAISFIAPLVSLYLAAAILGEEVRPRAVWGSVLGLVGVLVIVGGKFGRGNLNTETWLGLAAIIVSALLYAWNLVLQRQQAMVAKPTEIATFYMASPCRGWNSCPRSAWHRCCRSPAYWSWPGPMPAQKRRSSSRSNIRASSGRRCSAGCCCTKTLRQRCLPGRR
jgi:drug/metabolite transporter (DMT)-like permease